MKSASSFIFTVLSTIPFSVYAFPGGVDKRFETGVIITNPPVQKFTGTKVIPDADHPFIAPGPDDRRGPCPGMNTLANHGYIPRNGIVSFEDLVTGTAEGFNMDPSLSSALAAFGILSRGNAFINRVSIGLPSPLVPPLPGNIDGPVALGIATHGRFEGDVSMTRSDAAIGDNRNFNQTLYNELLAIVDVLGDDSPIYGPKSIANVAVMQQFKFNRFNEDQPEDPVLQYHVGRFELSYGEAAFALNFFANGTDELLSVPTMTSFFAHQQFPTNNWHRRATPGTFDIILDNATQIEEAHPLEPGANNATGQYVPDVETVSAECGLYNTFGSENVAAVLLNTTGILLHNVNFLLDAIYAPFASSCPKVYPAGACCI